MNETLEKTEKKTAYVLTLPAVLLVFAIVLFPIFANIWISFKDVELKDIRIPEPRAKKIVKSISGETTTCFLSQEFIEERTLLTQSDSVTISRFNYNMLILFIQGCRR